MDAEMRRRVSHRANNRCEYCHLPADLDVMPFQIDHIIPRKHGGDGRYENLAFSCLYCNSYKGPNVGGLDPESSTVVPLYDPRTEQWDQHFEWRGPQLTGKSGTGRATIHVLRINLPERVEHRRLLIVSGVSF